MARYSPLCALIIVLTTPVFGAEDTPPPVTDHGQWVTIPGADGDFSAIYTAPTAPTGHGAVVVIPDHQGHADRPGVTGPLRSRLPDFGWTTLAVPAPPADQPGGQLDIGMRRLQAAVDYLRQRNQERIVLAGHGLGAALGAAYLANERNAAVAGLVAIGWYDPEGVQDRLAGAAIIADIEVPVFDLFGSRDWDNVQSGAAERLQAARGADGRYRQRRVEGADHDHTGLGIALAQQVRGWLHTTFVKNKPTP